MKKRFVQWPWRMVLSTWCLALSTCAGTVQTLEITTYLTDAHAWERDCITFVHERTDNGFRFWDRAQKTCKSVHSKGVTWQGLKVYETRVYFVKNIIARVELDLYKKGDKRTREKMSEKGLNETIETVVQHMMASKAKVPPCEKGHLGDVETYQYDWPEAQTPTKLVWGTIGKGETMTVEFLRIELTPPKEILTATIKQQLKAEDDKRKARAIRQAARKAKRMRELEKEAKNNKEKYNNGIGNTCK